MPDTLCPVCGGPQRADHSIVHDPQYHGPAGHAPQAVCLECWAAAWGRYADQRDRECLVVVLLAEGYTQNETAEIVKVSARTVRRWLALWRRTPDRLRNIIGKIFAPMS